MSTNTKIEWCEHTDNLWHGCTKVHAGCDHCYAETLSHRWGRDIWGPNKPRMMVQSVWNDLEKQQRMAAAAGEMHRVFVGSMMDIFEKPMPVVNSKGEPMEFQANIHHRDLLNRPMATQTIQEPMHTGHLRNLLFMEIDAKKYPNLIFLFLTKRPSNIPKYILPKWMNDPPENVMFGISVSDQKTFDDLIPQLLKVKGKKFLSIEPLLGPIKTLAVPIAKHPPNEWDHGIDWIIVGGESGHGARPMHPDWVRQIRNECERMQIPFLFKQWGEWAPGTFRGNYTEQNPMVCIKENGELSWWAGNSETTINYSENFSEDDQSIEKIGKKMAGRELDGKTYSEFPWDSHAIQSTLKLEQ